jgi:hypothetical protein
MDKGRKRESGRPTEPLLCDLERRLEASFDALADDLSVGRKFTDPAAKGRSKHEPGRKGDREAR